MIDVPLPVHDERVRRLHAAVADGQPADVLPLARQVLLGSGVIGADLVVPDMDGLAGAAPAAGLEATLFGEGRVRLRATSLPTMPWLEGRHAWIDLASAAPGSLPTPDGVADTSSRPAMPAGADPAFTRATGHAAHLVEAQRSAARAVALAPPGAVTHVVLPTGSGKSDVGLLPALAGEGQVIVVVPTTAIAIDQERSLRSRGIPGLPEHLAWHGDLGQEERAGIIERLQVGAQRVVLTSPEALMTSLQVTVRRIAETGHLHTLVIDEAHLIDDWGLEFRPEFQEIAALREQLVAIAAQRGVAAVRVVLQTATLRDSTLQHNDASFPWGTRPALVGAIALRPEPRYLRVSSEDVEQSRDRLVRLTRIMPRPAIVYATRKRVAAEVLELLRAEGFHRVAGFDGDTTDEERRRILSSWQGIDEAPGIDVVVATAAFGLGVDQQDVRTVIHAETPSSVGQFYQEVGRGGRDGHASVSVLLSTPQDAEAALRVGDQTLIGDDKGAARWAAMRASMAGQSVDLAAIPSHLEVDSDENRRWNRNTLGLMQRAGLIRVVPAPLPPQGADEADWLAWRTRRGIHLLVDEIDAGTFERGLAAARDATRRARATERDGTRELRVGDRCFGEVFSETYRVHVGLERAVAIAPVKACSGCPGCRRATLAAVKPAVQWVEELDPLGRPTRLEGIGDDNVVVVHEEPAWLDRHGRELLEKLVQSGVRHVFAGTLGRRPLRWLHERAPYVAVDGEPERFRPFVRPSVVWRPTRVSPTWRGPAAGDWRMLVVESSQLAPDKPGERLADWWQPSVRASKLMEVL